MLKPSCGYALQSWQLIFLRGRSLTQSCQVVTAFHGDHQKRCLSITDSVSADAETSLAERRRPGCACFLFVLTCFVLFQAPRTPYNHITGKPLEITLIITIFCSFLFLFGHSFPMQFFPLFCSFLLLNYNWYTLNIWLF